MKNTKCAYCGIELKRSNRDFYRAKHHFCCVAHKALFQYEDNEMYISKTMPNTAILKIQDIEFLINTQDMVKVSCVKWCLKYDKTIKNYYARAWTRGNFKTRKQILLHRFIMNCPDDKEVDHINKNTLDNRRENLRCIEQISNAQNKGFYSNNKSGYKYIYWNKINQTYVCEIKRYKQIIFRTTSKLLKDIIAKRNSFIEEYNKENGNTIKRLSVGG